MSKNILIFSDGTGQKGGKGINTNVYKLFNMVENRTPRQIAFYDPGLGTDWRKVTGSMSGGGISKNLLQCYRFIFENYQAGDKIFLFGFSRGAATVRSLSAFINLFGILPKSREDLIRKAYKIYRGSDPDRKEKRAEEFIARHHTMKAKVDFIGVWDTVAALGLPFKWASVLLDNIAKHRFHDFKLSDSVLIARHALAIDDERKTFHPVVWDPLEKDDPPERLKQVWFCGMHTDVGGGYESTDLSNITLKWMIDEAKEYGLKIFKPSDAYQRLSEAKVEPNGHMEDSRSGMARFFRKEVRSWDVAKHGPPDIHETVFQRTKNQQNEDKPPYSPWILKLVNQGPIVRPPNSGESNSSESSKEI